MSDTDHPISDAEKLRRLPLAVLASAGQAVATNLTVFGAPFVLMLGLVGLPKAQIGLVLSLMPFAGVLALLSASWVARFGFKRTLLTFFALRYAVLLGLLFIPLVADRAGVTGVFWLTVAVLAAFAVCRALGETGYYSWWQEIAPHSVRGKFEGIVVSVTSLAGVLSLIVAGFVIRAMPGLPPFMYLIGAGIVFGFLSLGFYARLPGGAQLRGPVVASSGAEMLRALGDRRFLAFLIAVAAVAFALGLRSFLPLYLEEQIGIARATVVWLQGVMVAGTVATCWFWGWAADRYGGRPVALAALPLAVLVPLGWLALPRESLWSLPLAVALAALASITAAGWSLGTLRLLFVSIVPPARKPHYMAVYYASMGVVGGASPLLAGWVLDRLSGLSAPLPGIVLDHYSPLWIAEALLLGTAVLAIRRVQVSGELGARRFAQLVWQSDLLASARYLLHHAPWRPGSRELAAAEVDAKPVDE